VATSPLRPFVLVRTRDQWLRADHRHTALDDETGGVTLEWSADSDPVQGTSDAAAPPAGGLAFDASCRLYRSVVAAGRVERTHWAPTDPLRPPADRPVAVNVLATPAEETFGEFASPAPAAGPLREPRGLAVDEDDRLFVAESGASRILVYDLWSGRLLRRVPVAAPPLDLAVRGHVVWATLAGAPWLVRLRAREDPVAVLLPAGVTAPGRVAVGADGALYVLERAGEAAARVVPLAHPAQGIDVRFATDLEVDGDGLVVVARRPGEDFLRWRPGSGEQPRPLRARGYDGMGIVRTPDGRIAFWTDKGLRYALPARLRYERSGRVTTYRLDGGEYRTVWGRIFLDACIPEDTSLRVHFLTADEPADEDEPLVVPQAPANLLDPTQVPTEDSPPMPPSALALPDTEEVVGPLHRRATGRELPWTRFGQDEPFETYEAPVDAPPGRYLWVTLELRGDGRRTPRVKSVRVEHPAHDYLRRLPRTFSRDEDVAAFLRRYLSMFEGLLGDLDARAALRRSLVDPRSTPEEALPWLASFLGLVLDERWPADARRTLIQQAAWLFRFRGTVPGLRRFLEIYFGRRADREPRVPVTIIEHYRLRGMGGTLLGGEATSPMSRSIVGAGFRVGGAVGAPEDVPLDGAAVADGFVTHAHRFTVIVPTSLSLEETEVVTHVLEVHRPCHTLYELCTVGAGMRVGRGLHVGLTSLIGRTAGFDTAQVGKTVVGGGAIVGWPVPGTRPGASRLGGDTRAG
jgi:phage tail-like protein